MNCISYKEAQMVCAALGKRLPTAAEWEFAARSRNPDYYCPWPFPADDTREWRNCDIEQLGLDAATDRFYERLGSHMVCSKKHDVSDQGVCDLAANVAEFVVDTSGQSQSTEGAPTCGNWNASPGAGMFDSLRTSHKDRTSFSYRRLGEEHEDIRIGFRCVRDVSPKDGRARGVEQ